MISKPESNVNDCCSSFVDIGSMITENDNVLNCEITAESEQQARAEFDAIAESAKARFPDVIAQAQWNEDEKLLKASLTFSCAAECLIFQM